MSDETPPIYAVRLHRRARQDMDALRQRVEEFSSEKEAVRWQDALLDAIGTLATHPQRCPLAREDRLFKRAVRQFLFRRTSGSAAYRVLFTIYEASDEAPFVFVLHVRHASRSPMKRQEAQEIEAE